MLEAARAALRIDGDLLSTEQRAAIDMAIAELERAASSASADAIVAANLALAGATEEFAMQRMNRSIRTALSGARVDEVLASVPSRPSV